jgi:hypothetical protein
MVDTMSYSAYTYMVHGMLLATLVGLVIVCAAIPFCMLVHKIGMEGDRAIRK